MNFSLLNLSEDVKGLYFKTGIKEFEESYISVLAATAEDISDEEILSWIKGLSNTGVSDPKVEQALKSLANIDEKELINNWNTWLVENMRLPSSFAKPKGKNFDYAGDYIGYFIIFGKLFGNPSAGLLLRPFENILRFFSNPDVVSQTGVTVTPDAFVVFHDLMNLQNALIATKEPEPEEEEETGLKPIEEMGNETVEDKKQNLYNDLYNWFSNDFSQAASNLGYTDLADEFEKGGLLGNIEALKAYIDKNPKLKKALHVDSPNPFYMGLLEDIVKLIVTPANLKRYLKPENHIEAYRLIKEEIMKLLGYLDKQELGEIKQERAKQRKIPSSTKEVYYEKRPDPGREVSIADDSWMDGITMALISTVLDDLHLKFNL